MGSYLLDTCTSIWFFEGSTNIPARTRDELRDPFHDLYLSDVSILEIVIKHQLGKLPLSQPPSRIIPTLARKHFIDILPLESEAIFRLESLPLLHRDPFDRLLVAQALHHRLTLVTPDRLIHQYPAAAIWEM